MNREEFLRELGECLRGEVTEYEYEDTMRYYRDFFREEQAKGRSESEIIALLGSPRLIARSVIDARGSSENASAGGYYDAEEETYRGEEEVRHTGTDLLNKIILAAVGIGLLLLLAFLLRLLFPVALIVIVLLVITRIIKGDS